MDIAGRVATTLPTRALVEELVAARSATPTSAPTDLLADPDADPGPGWHRLDVTSTVPDGDLEAVRDHVLSWQVLRHVGIGVQADTGMAVAGATVVQRMPGRGPGLLAPCRVVAVADTADHVGFVYAALPGHPFTGEEAFQARRGEDGTVVCRVTSRSRPRARAAAALAPLLRGFQHTVARGYLHGMAAAARNGTDPIARRAS
jgi:uncharacterized protein (UPF0548 family)